MQKDTIKIAYSCVGLLGRRIKKEREGSSINNSIFQFSPIYPPFFIKMLTNKKSGAVTI
jgi:hypothetical protein